MGYSFLRFIFGIYLSFLSLYSFSQPINWYHNFVSDVDVNQLVSTLDNNGHLIIAGGFEGSMAFLPNNSSYSFNANVNGDHFIAKLDTNGQFIWFHHFPNNSFSDINSVEVDRQGNIYVTGHCFGPMDFDPSATTYTFGNSTSIQKAFVAKYNTNGDFLWANNLVGVTPSTDNQFIATDDSLNVYVLANYEEDSVNMHKYDTAGNLSWRHSFYSTFNTPSLLKIEGTGIEVDQNGNILIVGIFRDSVDFETDSSKSAWVVADTDRDGFVAKYNANGNLIWANGLHCDDRLYATGITVDDHNNIYSIGAYIGDAYFDKNSTTISLSYANTTNHTAAFICKWNADGDFVWADQGTGLSVNSYSNIEYINGKIFISGAFLRSSSYHGTNNTHGNVAGYNDQEVSLLKLDTNNTLYWLKAMNGRGYSFPQSLSVDQSERIYLSGKYMDSLDINPNLSTNYITSPVEDNFFVVSIEDCPPIYLDTINATACEEFYTKGGSRIYYSTNMFKETLPNSSGCDSTFYYNINILNDTIQYQTHINICDSFISPNGKVWDSTGVYYDTLAAANGCDSIIRFSINIMNFNQTLYQYRHHIHCYYSPGSNTSLQWLDCSNNFAVIPNDTSNRFLPSVNGSYAVEVRRNGCVDTTDCFNYVSVGLNENKTLENELSVHPVPADRNITLNGVNSKQIAFIEIRNISGAAVSRAEKPQMLEFNVASFKSGLYFITIHYLNQRISPQTVKFVKH